MPTEKPITVIDLMELLAKYPPQALVLYRKYSDFAPLVAEEILFVGVGELTQESEYEEPKKLICRNGHYMLCDPEWEQPGDISPALAAVIFPGN